MKRIRVWVIDRGRKYLYLRYVDPETGRPSEKCAYTRDPDAAQRAAGKWEKELHDDGGERVSVPTWPEFRRRYEDEHLRSLKSRTDDTAASTFNMLERLLPVVRTRTIDALDASRISRFQTELRKLGRSESTIKRHLGHLKAALRWAHEMGLLRKVPTIKMPKRAKGSKLMKGRPITGEEFERMLAAIAKVVTPAPKKPPKFPPSEAVRKRRAEKDVLVRESWRQYLFGLWWSGLRLEESLALWWDRDDRLRVDLSGKYPMLRIPGELEKGGQDRLLPIAPEFADYLLAVPGVERTGPVFKPLARRGASRPKIHHVSKIVSRIGEAAGVKVNTDARTGRVKYASAHDLRRSFGDRWASRIMPRDLMVLMRHESIETTMRYYAGRNADAVARSLWDWCGQGQKGDSQRDRAPDSSSVEGKLPAQPDAA